MSSNALNVECWKRGRLIAKHVADKELSDREILQRLGIGPSLTVIVWGQDDETSIKLTGRPTTRRTIQIEEKNDKNT